MKRTGTFKWLAILATLTVLSARTMCLAQTLGYQSIVTDSNGHLNPCYSSNIGQAYDQVIDLCWHWWKNCPNESNDKRKKYLFPKPLITNGEQMTSIFKLPNGKLLLSCIALMLAVPELAADEVNVCKPVDTYHRRVNQTNGKLESWLKDSDGPFQTILGYLMGWWRKCPDVQGWPSYMTACNFDMSYKPQNYGSNQASIMAEGVTSCLKYYYYTGEVRYRDMAVRMGDFIVQRDLTPDNCSWPNFPYATGETGDTSPDGYGHPGATHGQIMPDKGAMAGGALLELYKVTGITSYLNAAVNIANLLAEKVNLAPDSANSPWPFRIQSTTGTAEGKCPLCANVAPAIILYDELLRLGQNGNGKYATTKDLCVTWLKRVPLSDSSKWTAFFEDYDVPTNGCQRNALETARMFLTLKDRVDTNWLSYAKSLIDMTKSKWSMNTYASDGYTTVGEQDVDHSPYMDHAARLGSIEAMYYENGGASSYKEEGYTALCYGLYAVVDSSGKSDCAFGGNGADTWASDDFSDFTHSYIDAMAACPDWAGSTSTHLLRSTGTIKTVTYNSNNVIYSAYDSFGTDKLKLTGSPSSVMVNGSAISSYTWDGTAKVLVISRYTGTNVVVTVRN